MKYTANFSRGKWKEEDFSHIDYYTFPYIKKFIQADDHIVNDYATTQAYEEHLEMKKKGITIDSNDGFNRHGLYTYSPCMYKDKQKTGVSFLVDFSFDEFGAPTFFYSRKNVKEGNYLVSEEWVEVTAFEKGLNFWHVTLNKGKKTNNIKLVKHVAFPLKAKETHRIEILTFPDKFGAKINSLEEYIKFPMFDEGYIGFYACEGINRFYNFKII